MLTPYLRPETVALLDKIKPTEWDELKTDAIDFSQPFLWLDDDLYEKEREVLERHGALGNHVMVNLYKHPGQLVELVNTVLS